MAAIIPETINSSVHPSEGEVFDKLKKAPQDWVVFHSLEVPQRDRNRPPREIDFVLFIGQVVICLEVKGGHYQVQNGQWYTKHGEEIENPVKQSSTAMFTLKNYVEKYSRILPEILPDVRFEYGILFANADWPSDASRPEGCLLIDRRTFRDGKKLYRKLQEYANSKLTRRIKDQLGSQFGSLYRSRVNNQMDKLRKFLTPNDVRLGYIRVDRGVLNNIDEHLLKLTEEQYHALELAEDNNRVMIRGAAGTGKTILAMELARRRSNLDEKILLLCNSCNMVQWIGKQLSLPSVVVCEPSLLSVLFILFSNERERWNKYISEYDDLRKGYESSIKERVHTSLDASTSGRLPSIILLEKQDPYFLSLTDELENKMSSLMERAVNEYISIHKEPLSFDYLIVDEAQTLVSKENMTMMNILLKGGIADGNWTMFGDFDNQNISLPYLNKDFTQREFKQELKRMFSTEWSNWTLRINCRNAQPIAEVVSRVAVYGSYKSHPNFRVNGPEVRVLYFEKIGSEETNDVIYREVKRLRNQGVSLDQIVVVTSGSGVAFSEHECADLKLNNISAAYASLSASALNICDYANFQGLESDVIILQMDIPHIVTENVQELVNEFIRVVFYVSMSRAKSHLVVIAHELYKDSLDTILQYI